MHYKNGREAKGGDVVVLIAGSQSVVGVLHSVQANSESCNARLAHVTGNDPYVTVKECLHIDDITAANIPNSNTGLGAA